MVGADHTLSAVRVGLRGGLSGGEWRAILTHAIAEAEQERDPRRVASLAGLGAAHLTAEGRFREAVMDIDVALRVTTDDTALRRRLLASRASIEACGGDPRSAVATIEEASTNLGDATDDEWLEFTANSHVALLISLAEEPTSGWMESIRGAQARQMDWLAAGVKLWLAPWLIATGSADEAAAVTRSLSSQARAQRSTWRSEAARIYDAGLELVRGEPNLAAVEACLSANNMYTSWQAALLMLRSAVQSGDPVAMARSGDHADALAERFDGAFFNQIPIGGMLAEIYAGEPFEAEGFIPDQVTLVNLGSLLALMEAIAIGGSQAVAATWLRWLDEKWLAHVVTSLEWPVAVARIRGLLAARAGAFGRAIR